MKLVFLAFLYLVGITAWGQTVFRIDSLPAKGVPLKKDWKWHLGLADYAGTYIHQGYGKYSVRLTNDSLFLLTSLAQKYWLDHYHYDTFRLFGTDGGIDTTDVPDYLASIRFQFTTNLTGDIDGIAITGLEPSLDKPLVFARHMPIKQLSASELQKYVGEYESTNLTVRIELRGKQELFLLALGEPDYKLEFMGNHTFSNKKQPNYFVHFDVNSQGNVTTISAIQPNGTFTLARKAAELISNKVVIIR